MQSDRLQLVQAEPADWQVLQQLARDTFVAAFAAHNTPENLRAYVAKAFNDAQVQAELARTDSEFWLARYDGQLAGYLKINFGDAQNEPMDRPALEIERIYVTEAFQGTGIAQALLVKARERARATGARRIWLGVWERNPKAVRFYQKNGFRQFGEHHFVLGDETQTDWLMAQDLAFSMKDYLLDTFRFNGESNRRLLEKIGQLPEKAAAVRFFSHLIRSQDKWLARIQQDPAAPQMSWWEPEFPLEMLETAWNKSLQDWLDFLTAKEESELFDPVVFTGYDGGRWIASIKDIALQLNYHSIHHRAQIQTLVRQQGLEPDFIDYIGTVYQKLPPRTATGED